MWPGHQQLSTWISMALHKQLEVASFIIACHHRKRPDGPRARRKVSFFNFVWNEYLWFGIGSSSCTLWFYVLSSIRSISIAMSAPYDVRSETCSRAYRKHTPPPPRRCSMGMYFLESDKLSRCPNGQRRHEKIIYAPAHMPAQPRQLI